MCSSDLIGLSGTRWQNLFLARELLVGTDNLFVSNAGNIGIGTVSPLAVLHLVSTSTSDLFRIDDDGSGDTTPFLVDQDGNVGVGTTTPGYKLEVVGGTTKTTGGLIIETRTSDPVSPEDGRMWLRTDL